MDICCIVMRTKSLETLNTHTETVERREMLGLERERDIS